MIDLNLGHTQAIISECMRQGLLRNQAAYVLATGYWETARTMEPVEEAFWLSDDWRKKNLRYYPWHGRGFVQITWERNYVKAGKELGLDLTTDPTKVMEPDIAAMILVRGSRDGWFTGKKLDDYITLKESNFRGARRIINGTDKAAAIAEIARDYDKALISAGYGIEPEIPVVDDRRDGSPPRKSKLQSTTNMSVFGGFLGTVSLLSEQAKGIIGAITENFGVSPDVAMVSFICICLAWIFRERLRKWAQGDR